MSDVETRLSSADSYLVPRSEPPTLFDVGRFAVAQGLDDLVGEDPSVDNWKMVSESLRDISVTAAYGVEDIEQVVCLDDQILSIIKDFDISRDGQTTGYLISSVQQSIALTAAVSRNTKATSVQRLTLHTRAQHLLSGLEKIIPKGEFDFAAAVIFPDELLVPAAQIAGMYGATHSDQKKAYVHIEKHMAVRKECPKLFGGQQNARLFHALQILSDVDPSEKPVKLLLDARLEEAGYYESPTAGRHVYRRGVPAEDGHTVPEQEPEETTLIELLRQVYVIDRRSDLTRRLIAYAQDRGYVVSSLAPYFLTEAGSYGVQGDKSHRRLAGALMNVALNNKIFDEES